jgi:toxin ParE1/3/4
MTPRFVFRPEARRDLFDARDWYEEQRAGLGDAFANAIATGLDGIAAHPLAFPEVLPTVRRHVLGRFPFGIFYRRRTQVASIYDDALHVRAITLGLRISSHAP